MELDQSADVQPVMSAKDADMIAALKLAIRLVKSHRQPSASQTEFIAYNMGAFLSERCQVYAGIWTATDVLQLDKTEKPITRDVAQFISKELITSEDMQKAVVREIKEYIYINS